MSLKKYNFFLGFLDTQEKWLNKMAMKGYRLVRTTKVMYEFEPCKVGEYQYLVEFVGDKSYNESKKYREFLEELGYRTLYKNINMNFSIGKVRWRPWAKGMGQIATNSGTFNKELLIVEKQNDGKTFDLHTSAIDIVEYYKPIRNAHISTVFLAVFAFALHYFSYGLYKFSTIVFLLLTILLLLPIIGYQKRIAKYHQASKIEE
jgi:hypothetical protein